MRGMKVLIGSIWLGPNCVYLKDNSKDIKQCGLSCFGPYQMNCIIIEELSSVSLVHLYYPVAFDEAQFPFPRENNLFPFPLVTPNSCWFRSWVWRQIPTRCFCWDCWHHKDKGEVQSHFCWIVPVWGSKRAEGSATYSQSHCFLFIWNSVSSFLLRNSGSDSFLQ